MGGAEEIPLLPAGQQDNKMLDEIMAAFLVQQEPLCRCLCTTTAGHCSGSFGRSAPCEQSALVQKLETA